MLSLEQCCLVLVSLLGVFAGTWFFWAVYGEKLLGLGRVVFG